MDICLPTHRSLTGWRQAAVANSIGMTAISLIMFGSTAAAVTKAGGFNQPLIFYESHCSTGNTSQLNVLLHLIINIFSSLVLGSSNFFMQVLNSPYRREIDRAHARGSWLGIGAPSFRNIFRVAKTRTFIWALFLLTSILIHLLFNSTIFETDQRDSQYDLAIVSDPFLHAAEYFAPGASLQPSEPPYGEAVPLDNYYVSTSNVSQGLTNLAQNIGSWERINAEACKEEYFSCDGLTTHRNVALVVADQPDWTRDFVWDLSTDKAAYWDSHIPSASPNPLWFYGMCTMLLAYDEDTNDLRCKNSCREAMGGDRESTPGWTIRFFHSTHEDPVIGLHGPSNNLTIEYCLAEPNPSLCKVGLSTSLLASITACVIVKTLLCVFVYAVFRDEEFLVTPGDAIASFIANPDHRTRGMAIVSQGEIRVECRFGELESKLRQYHRRSRKGRAAIPSSTTVMMYSILFLLAVAPAGTLLPFTGFSGVVGQSTQNPLLSQGTSLIVASLTANWPQLLRSCFYFMYNNAWTRLQLAAEWALMSTRFAGLRTTDPKGSQVSTYRLQLPYRYSIPLIAASAVLQWLMSNSFYIFISEGQYFEAILANGVVTSNADLPPGTSASVGFSPISLILFSGLTLLLAVIPIFASLRKLPGTSNMVGGNSLAISAACHPSPTPVVPARISKLTTAQKMIETKASQAPTGEDHSTAQQLYRHASDEGPLLKHQQPIDGASDMGYQDAAVSERLLTISQSELRWGVSRMSDSWYEKHADPRGFVGHISLATADDYVGEPWDGAWYA